MFRSLSFTPWYALGEFVDNSISSYFQNLKRLEAKYGSATCVTSGSPSTTGSGDWSSKKRRWDCSRQTFLRACAPASRPKDTSVGLNLHGVGMKAAAFWWGRRLTIETWPLGERRGWKVEIDLGESGTQPQGTAKVHAIPARSHSGTRITVDGLWQNAPVAGKTRATVTAYFLDLSQVPVRGGELQRWETRSAHPVRLFVDGRQLSFDPPKLLSEPYWPTLMDPPRVDGELWRKKISGKTHTGKVIEGVGWDPRDHEPRTEWIHAALSGEGHRRSHTSRRAPRQQLRLPATTDLRPGR